MTSVSSDTISGSSDTIVAPLPIRPPKPPSLGLSRTKRPPLPRETAARRERLKSALLAGKAPPQIIDLRNLRLASLSPEDFLHGPKSGLHQQRRDAETNFGKGQSAYFESADAHKKNEGDPRLPEDWEQQFKQMFMYSKTRGLVERHAPQGPVPPKDEEATESRARVRAPEARRQSRPISASCGVLGTQRGKKSSDVKASQKTLDTDLKRRPKPDNSGLGAVGASRDKTNPKAKPSQNAFDVKASIPVASAAKEKSVAGEDKKNEHGFGFREEKDRRQQFQPSFIDGRSPAPAEQAPQIPPPATEEELAAARARARAKEAVRQAALQTERERERLAEKERQVALDEARRAHMQNYHHAAEHFRQQEQRSNLKQAAPPPQTRRAPQPKPPHQNAAASEAEHSGIGKANGRGASKAAEHKTPNSPNGAAYMRRETFGRRASAPCIPRAAQPSTEEARKNAETRAMEDVAKLRMRPLDERKKGFKELLRSWHPDKNPHNLQVATAVFQRLQTERKTLLEV